MLAATIAMVAPLQAETAQQPEKRGGIYDPLAPQAAPEVIPSAPSEQDPEAVPQAAALDQAIPEDEDPQASRERVLGELYGQLATTKDAETATAVASAIEQVWLHSGSDTVDLLMERAMSALGEEKPELALELLDAIVKIAPDYAEGWNRRAYVHFTRQNFGHALGDLQRVLSLDPKHFKAINGLAQIEREFGDSISALKAFRILLKVHPFLEGALAAEKELAREIEGQEI